MSIDFDHDAAGNITGVSTATASQRIFGLDALHRVTAMTDAAPVPALLEGFTYDATGNRTSDTECAITTPYSYPTDSHRLIDIGGTARSYDAVGNTLRRTWGRDELGDTHNLPPTDGSRGHPQSTSVKGL